MKCRLHIVLIGISILFFTECSEYSKVLKGNDYNLKYEKAVEYFEEGDCFKSLPLFEELMSYFRMTDKGEDVYYYYAQSQYCMDDYYLAGYYFKRFAKNFPNSSRAEECAFNSAVCYMKNSPEFNLDQSDTYKAIDEFQLFMNRYPSSELVDSCNTLIKDLRSKLELKSYEKSQLYFKMEKYRSAVIAFNSTLEEFPDTKYREDILFMIVKANFLFAINSIEIKKAERFEETINSYHTFVDSFEKSKHLKVAESYFNTCLKEIEKLTNSNKNGI